MMRRETICSTLSVSSRSPSRETLPPESLTSPETALSSVLLPAPLAPITVMISPAATVRSRPWSTSIFP